MRTTNHAIQRMSQRGISRAMVELVLEHGTPEQDKTTLGRKEALTRLASLRREEQLLKKVIDKGGVVVVSEGDSVITTYNCERRKH